MMLNLLRKFPNFINVKILKEKLPETTLSLTKKKITILGKGNVGSRVGKICQSFDMDVKFFSRGENIVESVRDSDIVVDCLSSNSTTKNILDKSFFNSLKRGSYFISVTGHEIWDGNALLESLDKNILAGAALDMGSIQTGDVNDTLYQKFLKNPKILVTPHIAYRTDVTSRVANDMMIDNIEAWLKGNPTNIL